MEEMKDTEQTLAPETEEEEILPSPTQESEETPQEAVPDDLPEEEKDYAALAEADLQQIRHLDARYAALTHLSQLPNAGRFAQLRDLGLTVAEALAATQTRPAVNEGKAHLRPIAGRGMHAKGGETLSLHQWEEARSLFSDLNDRQIAALYRRVSHR